MNFFVILGRFYPKNQLVVMYPIHNEFNINKFINNEYFYIDYLKLITLTLTTWVVFILSNTFYQSFDLFN